MDDAAQLGSKLAEMLTTRRLGRPAHVFERLGSTQDQARAEAHEGAPDGTLVWALEQTAGRGRMDRAWSSRRGAGLWFSVVLRPQGDPNTAALLSLAAGVGLARALQAPTAGAAKLKWPNDVLLHGHKLAGILAEAETYDGQVSFVVLGVGLNLDPGPGGFPAEIADRAAALSEASDAIDPAALLATLLAELEGAIDLAQAQPEELRRAWLSLSDTIRREVQADMGGGKMLTGRAVDLDIDGSLVIETADGGLSRVRAGEVVHLRPADQPAP
jgi:BirA family biotin operon repressor/biotin-[acetyl-CoA-carboxylase] ligase